MKKTTKTIASILIVLAMTICMLFSFTSCSKESEPRALSVLVCHTSGRKAPDYSNSVVTGILSDVAFSEGIVRVINVDGNPHNANLDISYELDTRYQNASENKKMTDARQSAALLASSLQDVTAEYPEIDLYAGLESAASYLHSLGDKYPRKTILIQDTGVATKGIINFSNNLIAAEPSAIVDLLKEKQRLIDLTGIEVVWIDTESSYPQPSIPTFQSQKILAIWKEIIEQGGGKFTPASGSSVEETKPLPDVTAVTFPEDEPIAFEADLKKESFATGVILDETQVKFVEDSATYLDADEATAVLRPVAECLVAHPELSLTLVGTIAGDVNTDFGFKLSYQRAEQVRNTLVSLGAKPEQLTVKGLGCSDPWHIADVGFDSILAQKNRKVVLIDSSSDVAKSL